MLEEPISFVDRRMYDPRSDREIDLMVKSGPLIVIRGWKNLKGCFFCPPLLCGSNDESSSSSSSSSVSTSLPSSINFSFSLLFKSFPSILLSLILFASLSLANEDREREDDDDDEKDEDDKAEEEDMMEDVRGRESLNHS